MQAPCSHACLAADSWQAVMPAHSKCCWPAAGCDWQRSSGALQSCLVPIQTCAGHCVCSRWMSQLTCLCLLQGFCLPSRYEMTTRGHHALACCRGVPASRRVCAALWASRRLCWWATQPGRLQRWRFSRGAKLCCLSRRESCGASGLKALHREARHDFHGVMGHSTGEVDLLCINLNHLADRGQACLTSYVLCPEHPLPWLEGTAVAARLWHSQATSERGNALSALQQAPGLGN